MKSWRGRLALLGSLVLAATTLGVLSATGAGASARANDPVGADIGSVLGPAHSNQAPATKLKSVVGAILPVTVYLTGIISGDALVTQDKASKWVSIGSEPLTAAQSKATVYLVPSVAGTFTIRFRIQRQGRIIGSGAPATLKVRAATKPPKLKSPPPNFTPPPPPGNAQSTTNRNSPIARPADQTLGSIGTYQTNVGCGGGDPNSLEKNGWPDSVDVAPYAAPEAGVAAQYIKFIWVNWIWSNGTWQGPYVGGSESSIVQSNPDYSDYVTIGSGVDAANLPTMIDTYGGSGEYHYVEGLYLWYNPQTGALDGYASEPVNSYTQFDLYDSNVTTGDPYCYSYSDTIG